jgi:phage shock protein PspC (stress-responsive transcriptional regulator)
MDKTIKINLGGSLFQIDEDAFKILRRYLQDIDDRLKNIPGGAETIEDLELRIAEIFTSQGAASAVISADNVEAMMAIIGKPDDFDTGDEPLTDRASRPRINDPKKLYRNPDDKIISGVCGGLAPFLNIDSVWIRLVFVILTFFFFMGPIVYITLWIALSPARSDEQKREMYGSNGFRSSNANALYKATAGAPAEPAGSGAGNAINEIFRAIGKVLFIILRIFLILTGIVLVTGGFTALVTYIMIFFLNYPGYFSTGAAGVNLFYLPDFLSYIVNPAVEPWLIFLSSAIIILPLLAIIYWGIKMIFWFRSKDGIISLGLLVVWVISIVAFSILLFNEGVGFAEMSGSVSEEVIERSPHDLYILAGKKAENLKFDKDLTFDKDYTVYINDENKQIHINTILDINKSSDKSLIIKVRKIAAGRNRSDAKNKAQGLFYNYSIAGDTIYTDEYFSLPQGHKWSFHKVRVYFNIPEGTSVHFDQTTENMIRGNNSNFDEWDWKNDSDSRETISSQYDDHLWVMTEDGLRKRSAETDCN